MKNYARPSGSLITAKESDQAVCEIFSANSWSVP